MIRAWWEKRGTAAPDVGLLPEIGVIVEDETRAIACAFLYQDIAGRVAMVEWEATNPEVGSALTTVRALDMVFDFLETFSAKYGYAVVLSWVAEGRGDGRLLARRRWVKCPGERHELMAFATHPEEVPCRP